jgi:DNA recombination protein RmuC
MLKMDDILERLSRQAGAFSGTIERARLRTRAIGGKLRDLGTFTGGVPSLDVLEDRKLEEVPDEVP